MNDELSITTEGNPAQRDCDQVRRMLERYNEHFAGADAALPLAVFARDASGKIVGGLVGGTWWKWLHVDLLWVEDRFRRRGIGSRLLAAAETEAVRRRCGHSILDTHDFQAPEFYLRHGYQVFGTVADLPAGHSRIYFQKAL